MGTKKEKFHKRSKGGDFEKSKFSVLRGVLETLFSSTTLQEVGILPTLVIFHFKGCLVVFYALRGYLAVFFLKGLFGEILGMWE